MDKFIELLPKSWNDITLEVYQEIYEIENSTEFESNTDFLLELLACVLQIGSDDEMLEDISIDEVCVLIDRISWIRKPLNIKFQPRNCKYTAKSFNKITLGEFIDIEHYLSKDNILNIHYLCAIMYRRVKLDEWDNTIYEPYNYDIEERSKEFLDYSIVSIIGILDSYMNFRNNFLENYKPLFEGDDHNEEIVEDEYNQLEGRDLIDAKIEHEQNKIKQKWSWDALIWELCNEDITKFDEVTDSNLILVFNMLAMKKSLS